MAALGTTATTRKQLQYTRADGWTQDSSILGQMDGHRTPVY